MWFHTASRLIALFFARFVSIAKGYGCDAACLDDLEEINTAAVGYKEWNVTAERVFAEAEAQLAAGHRLTARDSYLRSTILTSILSKNP
jgi:hypothetical protein